MKLKCAQQPTTLFFLIIITLLLFLLLALTHSAQAQSDTTITPPETSPAIPFPSQQLRVYGVEKLPFLFPPGVADWLHLEDTPYGGPLGTYFRVLLNACTGTDTFTYINWTSSGRAAEFQVVTGFADIAFPVVRSWQLSTTSFSRVSGNLYFVPMLSSPGTSVLTQQTFSPITIAQALITLDTGAILVTVLCFAIVAGVIIWFIDSFDPRSGFVTKFSSGVGDGIYWAIVTMTATGYGEFIPKTKVARVFTVIFILAGVILIALLQSFVVSNLAATRSVGTIKQNAMSYMNGIHVGTVNSSMEEWRMRSRGAIVSLYDSIELAMQDLVDGELDAVAVDALAAGLITNTLGNNVVRQTGKIEDPLTYGMVMTASVAQSPSIFNNLNLAQCFDSLIRTGPMKFSELTYFRPYATNFQFSLNADLEDQQEQSDVAHDAMVQAAIILPLSTLGFLLATFYFNRGWEKKKIVSDPNVIVHLPGASVLPPMPHHSTTSSLAPYEGDEEEGEELVEEGPHGQVRRRRRSSDAV